MEVLLLSGILALARVAATEPLGDRLQRTADVVVYGATPAGIAAALGAADAGVKNVALLCEEYEIGGMMTLGGLGFRDHHTAQLLTGTMEEWTKLNSEYYKTSAVVYQPDTYVGIQNLREIIHRRPAVSIEVNTTLVEAPNSVVKNGTRIVSIDTGDSNAPKPIVVTTWHAQVFIDATYAGDLMRASDAKWTYGRESMSQYNESLAGVQPLDVFEKFEVDVDATWSDGTLLYGVDGAATLAPPGDEDHRVMGYSYRPCITKNENNKVPFPKPPGYNTSDWELLRRYYKAMSAANKTVNPPFGALGYYGYPPRDKFDVCDSGTRSPITTDAANLAKGFPNGTRAERNRITAEHKEYVQGILYFLITDPSVPKNVYEYIAGYGLCKDQWPENEHWPPQLYVREAGRLVGDHVYTQNDRISSNKLRRVDSIAVGDWSIDIHVMSRTAFKTQDGSLIAKDEGQTPFSGVYTTFQFDLPYYVLLPRKEDVSNLLVPNCPSVSHVVFGSVREEPTLWQLGRSSGVAAALLLQSGTAVSIQDLNVSLIQNELIKQKAVIHWPASMNVPNLSL